MIPSCALAGAIPFFGAANRPTLASTPMAEGSIDTMNVETSARACPGAFVRVPVGAPPATPPPRGGLSRLWSPPLSCHSRSCMRVGGVAEKNSQKNFREIFSSVVGSVGRPCSTGQVVRKNPGPRVRAVA